MKSYKDLLKNLLEQADPCWKGYKQYGTKKKGNKEVPNCVPVQEVAPDDPEIEDWIKKNKEEFKKQYGDKYKEVLYAKAWKMFNDKQESIEEAASNAMKDLIDDIKFELSRHAISKRVITDENIKIILDELKITSPYDFGIKLGALNNKKPHTVFKDIFLSWRFSGNLKKSIQAVLKQNKIKESVEEAANRYRLYYRVAKYPKNTFGKWIKSSRTQKDNNITDSEEYKVKRQIEDDLGLSNSKIELKLVKESIEESVKYNKGTMLNKDNIVSKTDMNDNKHLFVVVKRDIDSNNQSQDKFAMYKTDKNLKVVDYYGSHPSDSGALKFAKNKNLIENLEESASAVSKELKSIYDTFLHTLNRTDKTALMTYHVVDFGEMNIQGYYYIELRKNFDKSKLPSLINSINKKANFEVDKKHTDSGTFKNHIIVKYKPEIKESVSEDLDVFLDENTNEQYYVELDEETLEERKIIIRVTSKGERIKRIKCPPGRVVKSVNGRRVCVTPTGKERLTKVLATRRTLRTKKAKGAGYKKRVNFKRQKALRRRKQMFGKAK